jgi:hypothetical protein
MKGLLISLLCGVSSSLRWFAPPTTRAVYRPLINSQLKMAGDVDTQLYTEEYDYDDDDDDEDYETFEYAQGKPRRLGDNDQVCHTY